jgi:hypothetical protein
MFWLDGLPVDGVLVAVGVVVEGAADAVATIDWCGAATGGRATGGAVAESLDTVCAGATVEGSTAVHRPVTPAIDTVTIVVRPGPVADTPVGSVVLTKLAPATSAVTVMSRVVRRRLPPPACGPLGHFRSRPGMVARSCRLGGIAQSGSG